MASRLYDTFRQAGDDEARGTPYRHVRAVLTIVALDGESLGFAGKPVFYLEQALDGQLAQPYRQRVLVLDAGTSGAATLWDYRIANPADLVSATPEKLRALTHERLSREAGCELTWVRWTGNSTRDRPAPVVLPHRGCGPPTSSAIPSSRRHSDFSRPGF